MGTRRLQASIAAALLALIVYVAVAWVATFVAIPASVPTAQVAWLRPFRVVAALGFAAASHLPISHLAGDFLAAIVIGGLLGAVFAFSRAVLS